MSENEQLIIKLLAFYSANSLEEVILAQNRQIEGLQKRLSIYPTEPYYLRPRG